MALKDSLMVRMQSPSDPRDGELLMELMMACRVLSVIGSSRKAQTPTLGSRGGSEGGGPCAASSAATRGPTWTKNSFICSAEMVGFIMHAVFLLPKMSAAQRQTDPRPC